jgi:hypothetical protein
MGRYTSAVLVCVLLVFAGSMAQSRGADEMPDSLKAEVPKRALGAGEAGKAGEDEGQARKAKPIALREGRYRVEGTTGGGAGVYKGLVEIKRNGETFHVQWKIGKDVYSGIAMVEGDTFCVSCVMQGRPCVVVYKIGVDGSLSGRWSMQQGVVDIELLKFDAPLA